ncbi:MAG: hypothetical protein GF308_12020 [Candidatus Heimdallarchaeota archaeon]|nr:hypothetical protein [Candidatus Heimdallarchaeota archaeon]
MSKINEKQKLIDNFLKEVKTKLPFWLKSQEEELEDILNELENHIWDRATEQAQGGEPTAVDVQKAIAQMGSPREIAKEYKRRGSPKYYITEELWPWYLRSLIIIAGIIFMVNVLVMAFGLASGNAGTVVGNFFEGLFTGFLIELVVITSIFVGLSMEGFLPEDFQKMTEGAKTPAKTTGTKEIPQEVKEKPKKTEKKEKKPSYYRGKNYLGDGISGIISGILFMVLPMIILQEYVTQQFIIWLALLGVLSVITGIIRFTQALIGKNLRLQQLFMGLSIIPSALNIPLFLALINRPAIMQTTLLGFFPNANIPLYISIGVYVIVAAITISIIVEIIRMIRLELEGFPGEKAKTI